MRASTILDINKYECNEFPYSGNIFIYFSKERKCGDMISVPEVKYCCNCKSLEICPVYKKKIEYNYSCRCHIPI